MSITDFIIWNSLINNNSYNKPIEVSSAFETFIGYLMLGLVGIILVVIVIMLGILLWGVIDVAWNWLKDKYTIWKWRNK